MNELESPDNLAPQPTDIAGEQPYALFRERDFVRYLIGRFTAAFGQNMLSYAVGWELYERTGSALALGLVGLSFMLPMVLCTLPAGHVADNYNRKRIILTATLFLAAASFGLMLISALQEPVARIYLCLMSLARRGRSSGRPAPRFCRTSSPAGNSLAR
jgi:MFS family permease